MNEPHRFKRLHELATELSSKLSAMNEGRLPVSEIENLTDQSRELFERLVVLRFKSYNDEIKGSDSGTSDNLAEEKPPVVFRLDEPKQEPTVSASQVSLIDAIEEITRQENPVVNEAPPSGLPVQQESLNDLLAKSIPAQESLARKLEHTAIADLKRAITLNQRFQFSKELFKGNNQDYEVCIERLNSSSRDEAMKTLQVLRSKYAWNEESPITQDFCDLVDRRHKA